MANHVSHAALPYPIRGCRYTLLVPYLNISGIPVDPTTPDTEISKDGGAFADCTEEVTTITGSNGLGYITLTGDETNCSLLALAAKVASGPNSTLATIYPRVLSPFTSGTVTFSTADTITLGSNAPNFDVRGCLVQTTSGNSTASLSNKFNQARTVISYAVGTKVATVAPPWETDNLPSLTMGYVILINEAAPAALYCNLTAISGTVLDNSQPQLGTNIVYVTGVPINHKYEQFGANVVNIQPNTMNAAAIADGAIDDATYSADTDKYQAKIWLLDDNTGTTDRYAVCWFKNGQPITSGITSPTIQVIKAADGTNLIASSAMTEIGALGLYKYEAVTTERITSGSSYIAKVTATIGGSSRTWYSPVGRDT